MIKELKEIARFTPEPKAAIEFYKTFLGAKPLWESPDGAQFSVGSIKVLIHKIASSGGSPAEDHVAFEVEDVDAACQELQSKGLRVEKGPRDYEWGRSAYLKDPDGRWLELHQSKH